jgi:Family of unknown function (DUF6152)
MPSTRCAVSIVVVTLWLGATASAHHNMTALFNLHDKVTLSGKLTKVDWRNPHIYLTMDANFDGQLQTWSIEGPAPAFFRTRDVTKEDVFSAVGQTVTAEASRARDGSNSGLLRLMNLPGGKILSACPQNC